MEDAELRIESGKIVPSKKTTPDWKLHKGNGNRTYTEHIRFSKRFPSSPIVQLSFSTLDVLTDADHRISTAPINVDQDGFDLQINTWEDTQVWSAAVSWIAYDKGFSTRAGNMICSGTASLRKNLPGYGLHKGHGDRDFKYTIDFPKAFTSPPNIFVAFSQLDVFNGKDTRVKVYTNNIKNGSFECVVGTWSDTHVWSTGITWIAFDKNFSDTNGPDLKIQTGRQPFKKDNPGYNLWKGEGDRSIKRRQNFVRKFGENPTVITSLCELDVVRDYDHRISTVAENSSSTGFDIKLGTWNDTLVWGGSVSWLAFGKGQAPPPPAPAVVPPPAAAAAANDDADGQSPAKKQKTEHDNASSSSSNSKEEEDDSKECKVCMDNPINTVLVPCGHLCVCESCSQLLTKNKHSALCPICKGKIKSVVKTFLA
eukprot:TRINITY_DN1227_c0_g1_i1.p1 TRINITY_DN1227_c0_g1~~TRINITY_DN1227_c0_g1_i1.p1  ORF type:complete len:425 (+),score=107.88 TRINITY_DN1227_c0_g1_i1:59-1333(+)